MLKRDRERHLAEVSAKQQQAQQQQQQNLLQQQQQLQQQQVDAAAPQQAAAVTSQMPASQSVVTGPAHITTGAKPAAGECASPIDVSVPPVYLTVLAATSSNQCCLQ